MIFPSSITEKTEVKTYWEDDETNKKTKKTFDAKEYELKQHEDILLASHLFLTEILTLPMKK